MYCDGLNYDFRILKTSDRYASGDDDAHELKHIPVMNHSFFTFPLTRVFVLLQNARVINPVPAKRLQSQEFRTYLS